MIVRGCFDRTRGLNKSFLHLMRALLMLMFNYDKPSCIFPCILLTRNHMIFLVQFGINKHLLIFSKTTNCTCPKGSCNFVSKKIYLCLFIPNCTRNHVITYTNKSEKVTHLMIYVKTKAKISHLIMNIQWSWFHSINPLTPRSNL